MISVRALIKQIRELDSRKKEDIAKLEAIQAILEGEKKGAK